MKWMAIVSFGLIYLLAGCAASAPNVESSPLTGDPLLTRVQNKRDEQLKILWQYDQHQKQGEGACSEMCVDHTQICVLSTEICRMRGENKGHKRARLVCEAATKTCRETNERLPGGCWCP